MTWELAISLLAKVTLLLLAALALDSLLRRKWVLTTAALWNAVLLAVVALPVAALLVPAWTLPVLPPQPQKVGLPETLQPELARSIDDGPGNLQKEASIGPVAAGSMLPPPSFSPFTLLTAIYTLGVAVLLARLAVAWRAAVGLRRRALPVVHRDWLGRLDVWQGRLGTSGVRLLQSEEIGVPMALGIRERVIVIPRSLAAEAPEHVVDSVLAHELAHLARGDYAWLLVERVVEALLWFHPLVWVARRRMAFIRERACDEFVVHATKDADRYSQTLLDLAAQFASRRSLALGLAVLRSSNLSRRLAALEQSEGCQQCKAPASTRLSLAASAVIGAVLLAVLAVGREATPQEKPTAAKEQPKAKAGEPAAVAKPVHKITVTGKALDDKGAPLAGATIFLVSTNSLPETLGKTTTDREGKYEFKGAPLPLAHHKAFDSPPTGYFQVFGKAPERAFAWRGMKVLVTPRPNGTLPDRFGGNYFPGEKIELDLTFAPARQIRGRFINEAGEPVAGVKIRLGNCDFLDTQGKEEHKNYREFWAIYQAVDLMPEEISATSDAQGRFEFTAIPPEVVCWLLVEHADYAHLSLYTATTERPLDKHDEHPVVKLPIEKTLRATRTIPIEVRRDDNNEPVAGVRVNGYQQRATGDEAHATSDEMGRLTLKLPPGKYKLMADPSKGDFIRTHQDLEVTDAPASQPATIKLLSGCVLVLKAVDVETGAGIPGVTFWVEEKVEGQVRRYGVQSNTWYISHPKSNDMGELRAVVPPGTRRYGVGVHPFPDGYEAADRAEAARGRELELTAGKTVTTEFSLRRKKP